MIYNVLGQEVRMLVHEVQGVGRTGCVWPGGGNGGVYLPSAGGAACGRPEDNFFKIGFSTADVEGPAERVPPGPFVYGLNQIFGTIRTVVMSTTWEPADGALAMQDLPGDLWRAV